MSGSWAKALRARPEPFLRFLFAAAVGLAAFAVYLATLSPTILSNDAGRFQIAVPLLGTGHPTGYPTFILLGKLFTFLPVGDVAYRVNLMAAVFGGISVALLFLVAREAGARLLPAAGAALLAAFSATFWSQATMAEVYTMHAAFLLGITYLLLLWRRTGGRGYVLAAALLSGLSLGNNAGMVLLAPAYLALLAWGRLRVLSVRLLAGGALLFLAGLSVYIYVPIRGFAGAWHNYGDPVNDWGDVWTLVSGARFRGLMDPSPVTMLVSGGRFLGELATQAVLPAGVVVGAALLVGGAWGGRVAVRRDRAVGWALILGLACTLLYALAYQIDDIAAYYIPVYLFLAVLLAVGVSGLGSVSRRASPLLALPLALAALALVANYDEQDMSGYDLHRERGEAMLERLPEDAIFYGKLPVLPVSYLQQVEEKREDLTVRWLDGGTLEEHFVRDLRSGRPVYFVYEPGYTPTYEEAVEPHAEAKRELGGVVRMIPR